MCLVNILYGTQFKAVESGGCTNLLVLPSFLFLKVGHFNSEFCGFTICEVKGPIINPKISLFPNSECKDAFA